MKELLTQYAGYHLWANGLMAGVLVNLPEELHHKEVPSSFPSLYKTVLHTLDAESIWWQRLKLQERIAVPSSQFSGGMKELTELLHKQNKQWQEWVAGAQEHMLQHVFQYQTMRKEQFKQPVYQMLLHVFNHGTYHRGQLVTILRQLGIEKIPQTDFIVYSRRRS